jgi:general secretion pathway protein G
MIRSINHRGVVLAVGAALTVAWPARAAELANQVPEGSLLYLAWPGADEMAKTSQGTAWAKLLAEPEVQRFRQAWREQIWPALDRKAREAADGEREAQAYQAGLALLSAVWHRPAVLGVTGFDMTPEGPRADAAFILRAGEQADDLARELDQLVRMATAEHGSQVILRDVSIGDARLTELVLQEFPMPIRYGAVGGDLVITLGTKHAELWAAGTPDGGLASSERFQAAMKGARGSAATPVFFLDIRGVVALLEKFQPMLAASQIPVLGEPGGVQRILESAGLGNAQSLSMAVRPEGDGYQSNVFLHAPGPKKGTPFDVGTLSQEDLQVVPRDVWWATVGKFNLLRTYETLLDVLGAMSPQVTGMVEPMLQGFEQQLGFRIKEDLLASFGDTWAIYDGPGNGGILFTGITVIAELQPDNHLDESMRKLTQAVAGMVGEEHPVSLREETYRDQKITFVNVGNLPMPVAPAWCQYEGKWIAGLWPQMVRVALDGLMDGGPTLLDNPDFQRGLKYMPKEYASIEYIDSWAGMRWAYGLALPVASLLTSMGQGEGIEADASLLPSYRTLTKHLFGYVSATTVTDDGALTTSHGPTPLAMDAALGGVAGAAVATSVLLPSLARAREMAKRAASASNLKAIAVANLIYAEAHRGTLPPGLEVLTQNAGDRAYLKPEQLRSPRELMDSEVAYVYVPGQKNTMDPRNVLAYEDPDLHNTEEGLNVAFLDGHVEWMTMEAFEAALDETRERIAAAKNAAPENRDAPRPRGRGARELREPKARAPGERPGAGNRRGQQNREELTRALVAPGGNLATMLELYRIHVGRYPQQLRSLTEKPDDEEEAKQWAGPYATSPKFLKDAWGRELLYKFPGEHRPDSYDLYSLGADGEEGTDDDIANFDQN